VFIAIPAAILAIAAFLAPAAPIFEAVGVIGASAGVYGDYQRLHSVTINRRQFRAMQHDIASLKREVARLRLLVSKQHAGGVRSAHNGHHKTS
jgi:hypothetical protein